MKRITIKNAWQKSRKTLVAAACAVISLMGQTANAWDLWDQFAAENIENGRVVDASDERRITTSEGQSYALFFALVANERPAFEKLLTWTENNLAEGDLTKHLPAWLWGRQRNWGVIDSNNASDSDLWIAWCLLEADRLWKVPAYRAKALGMMELLLTQETRQVAGLGPVVLPGHAGFEEGKGENRVVKLNPSYAPIFLLRRLALEDARWEPIVDAALAMLVRASPSGFAPEWARFSATGRLVKPEGEDYTEGSYNAIRTYLWAGMTSPADTSRNVLIQRFAPMVEATREWNLPPRRVNVVTGTVESVGPDYFGACLLPLLKSSRAEDIRTAAMIRTVLSAHPVEKNRYYGNVLTLFGLGFDAGAFSFDAKGRLITGPDWREKKPTVAGMLDGKSAGETPSSVVSVTTKAQGKPESAFQNAEASNEKPAGKRKENPVEKPAEAQKDEQKESANKALYDTKDSISVIPVKTEVPPDRAGLSVKEEAPLSSGTPLESVKTRASEWGVATEPTASSEGGK